MSFMVNLKRITIVVYSVAIKTKKVQVNQTVTVVLAVL